MYKAKAKSEKRKDKYLNGLMDDCLHLAHASKKVRFYTLSNPGLFVVTWSTL